MTNAEIAIDAPHAAARSRRGHRTLAAWIVGAIVVGNAVAIVWLWVARRQPARPTTTGEALTSIGRLTGLLGAYLALIQVILLARIPALERVVGFDRLTVWHRWNGHVCIDLVDRARDLHRLGLRADGQAHRSARRSRRCSGAASTRG